jgi:hypothetical protein
MKGLSRVHRKVPARFLGEGMMVTSFPLPDLFCVDAGLARF